MIADTPHLREKTAKIGYVGRSAAIFRVNEIIVYSDEPQKKQNRESNFITLLLSYLETPQYLRKRLFELKPELQFAGILPPLRTPHHPQLGRIRDLEVGDYREGLVLSKVKEGMLIDIGTEELALLLEKNVSINSRVTVQIIRTGERVIVQSVNRDEVPDYWGYVVTEEGSLGSLLEKRMFDLTIGTSKFATRFQDAIQTLGARWKQVNQILLVFGAPTRGLHEIAQDEGKNLNSMMDFVLNTIPGQGTETVRTEEAVMATLAILNIHFEY
jgi:predicted SPOUT superfamily RNA methylase MTH1